MTFRFTFFCMREAVELMLEAGKGGRIVSITTIGSERPVLHGNGAYNSSRGAVTLLSKSTAYDYAKDGILVNVIQPGAVMGETALPRIHPGGHAEGLQTSPGSGSDPNHLHWG